MKISIDSGALCAEKNRRFGNFTFTKNLIEAIHRHDKNNEYIFYSFCDRPNGLLWPKKTQYKIILPKKFWMKFRVSLEELIEEKDVFLALNQALPYFSNAKIISFSHGLSFYFYPQYYPKSEAVMKDQLDRMIKKSDYLIVSSIRIKKEFNKIYPDYKKIEVLPYGIPFDFMDNKKEPKKYSHDKYFLYVGMNHPIKNISFIVKAFEEFTSNKDFKSYKLFLIDEKEEYKVSTGNIISIKSPSRATLKNLYQNAVSLLTASFYESFNLPVLEALSQNCQVIGLRSAIIPEFNNYVYQANSKKEFMDYMKKTALGYKKKINLKKLRSEFSWEKYVSELLKLY